MEAYELCVGHFAFDFVLDITIIFVLSILLRPFVRIHIPILSHIIVWIHSERFVTIKVLQTFEVHEILRIFFPCNAKTEKNTAHESVNIYILGSLFFFNKQCKNSFL